MCIRDSLQTVQQMERVSMDYKEFLTEHYKDFDDTTMIILDLSLIHIFTPAS